MKIIFMGTPDFAVPSLCALDDRYGVSLVLTQPDKPVGRGKKVRFSPVKEEAMKRGIVVLQPERLRRDQEVITRMKSLEPDFIIVVAYGQILSEEVLAIPRYGCINLHASLLPKLRGAAPLNYALIEGYKETGNTTMLMDKGLDTGDMLLRETYPIDDNLNVEELHDRLSQSGGDLLLRTVEGLLNGSLTGEKQDSAESTYAPLITKETCEIDWNVSAREIHNRVRGLSPVPGAVSTLGQDRVKILETLVLNHDYPEPGKIVEVSKDGILVAAGKGAVLIKRLQFPGKKPMAVRDFLNGHTVTETKFTRSDL